MEQHEIFAAGSALFFKIQTNEKHILAKVYSFMNPYYAALYKWIKMLSPVRAFKNVKWLEWDH